MPGTHTSHLGCVQHVCVPAPPSAGTEPGNVSEKRKNHPECENQLKELRHFVPTISSLLLRWNHCFLGTLWLTAHAGGAFSCSAWVVQMPDLHDSFQRLVGFLGIHTFCCPSSSFPAELLTNPSSSHSQLCRREFVPLSQIFQGEYICPRPPRTLVYTWTCSIMDKPPPFFQNSTFGSG